jgi:hypothetical protein
MTSITFTTVSTRAIPTPGRRVDIPSGWLPA